MEVPVIFQCINGFGQRSKIGYITAITRIVSWGVIEDCPPLGFDNWVFHVE